MREKDILGKYNYYKDVLLKLGEYNLQTNPKIEDLNLSRGVIQAGYKEMFKIDFKGTIIDYLCYVSTQYITHLIKTSGIYEFDKAFYSIVIKGYNKNHQNIRNMVRLYFKCPHYLLNSIDKRIWELYAHEIVDKNDFFFEKNDSFEFLCIDNNSVEKYNNIDSRFRSHIISFVSYLLTIISNIELTRETIPVKNFQKEFIHELEIVKSTANNFLDEPSK